MTNRIKAADLKRVRCAQYHGGSHRLTRTVDGRFCECQGCGNHYSAAQVSDAISGVTQKQMGQGGVTAQ